MRRAALLGLILAACSPQGEPREAVRAAQEAFTSAGAELVDFSYDGSLVTATNDPGEIDGLVLARLSFSVGQLNGDSSVARVDHADVDAPRVTALSTTPQTFDVQYHATLPVAWGRGAVPQAYELLLPKRVGDVDQTAFASK
jgi:hypothetical protein